MNWDENLNDHLFYWRPKASVSYLLQSTISSLERWLSEIWCWRSALVSWNHKNPVTQLTSSQVADDLNTVSWSINHSNILQNGNLIALSHQQVEFKKKTRNWKTLHVSSQFIMSSQLFTWNIWYCDILFE
jgi:hypothetical protein